MAFMVAFWIYVGTTSPQGQGGRRPEWTLVVQVGLDMEAAPWQVAQFLHPSARAAGQAAPRPGLIQLAPGQLCKLPPSCRPHLAWMALLVSWCLHCPVLGLCGSCVCSWAPQIAWGGGCQAWARGQRALGLSPSSELG